MNAPTVLRNNHQLLAGLFDRTFGSAGAKEEVARKLITELSVQAFLEAILFRFARDRSEALEHLAQRGAEAHNVIATTLRDLERLLAGPADSKDREGRLDAILSTLQVETGRHIQEATLRLIPELKRRFNEIELESIGRLMICGRPVARRHPRRCAPRVRVVRIDLGNSAATR